MRTFIDLLRTKAVLSLESITNFYEELESFDRNALPEADLKELDREKEAVENFLLKARDGAPEEKWRDVWYPDSFIRNDYFYTYAQELAEEIGLIPADEGWPFNHINWEQAAEELKLDYRSVSLQSFEFWYRAE